MTNKRTFPRKKLKHSCDLMISGERLPAVITDISPAGIGILVTDRTDIDSDSLDLRASGLDLECSATVVWKQKMFSGVRLGVARKGPISGELSIYGFSDIVMGLQRAKKTGTLGISSGTWKRKIFFRDGEMVFSSSDLEHEQLGNMLISSGRITEAQHLGSLAAAKKTGRSQGAMLVEMGYLAPQELISAVRMRVEMVILNLCSAANASFSFSEAPLSKDETVSMKINSAELIYNGYRNASNFKEIRERVFPPDGMVSPADPALSQLNRISLDEKDRQILSLVRDWTAVKEVAAQSPAKEEETLRVLYGLAAIHAINLETVERQEPEVVREEPTLRDRDENENDDNAISEKIERLYNSYQTLGYLGILGLGPNPSSSEIKRAYYDMAKEYHPDRYLHIRSRGLKEKLNIIFAYISEAYRELSKSGGTVTRPSEAKQEQNEPADNKTLAKAKYNQARDLISEREYEQAMTLFGQAVYLDDSVADYHYYYGMMLLKNKKLKDAETSIRKALKLSPYNASYITELGHIYLKLGFKTRAKNAFEQALKINPANTSASEGLRKSMELQ